MFRFPTSPARGLLALALLIALLSLHLPVVCQARSPYERTVAQEGDPGDGVLDMGDGTGSGGSADVEPPLTGEVATVPIQPIRQLLPGVVRIGPSLTIWLYLDVQWIHFDLRPAAGAETIVRGW